MHARIFTVLLLAAAVLSVLFALGTLLRGATLVPARPRLRLRVAGRRDHGHDLFTLVLRRPCFARLLPLPAFVAGQSVALSLPGQNLRRRYSIARWQARPYRYELTIKREEQGKLSRLLADQVHRGVWLSVERPSGQFVLPARATVSRAVMIAGGVGITPLLAMVDQWHHQRGSFATVHLYWQVRYQGEWVYREALERLARRDPRLHLRFLASRPKEGAPERISAEMLRHELGGLIDTQFFLCAGQSLLDAMVAGLIEQGVARDAVHFERFGVAPAGAGTGEWEVELEGRRSRFSGHASILDALEDAGVSLPSDCRAGSCGQCRLTVLSGTVEHSAQVELKVPPGQVLACCAVPRSDLRLARLATASARSGG